MVILAASAHMTTFSVSMKLTASAFPSCKGPHSQETVILSEKFTVTSFPDVFRSSCLLTRRVHPSLTSSSAYSGTESEISRSPTRPTHVQGAPLGRPGCQALENVVLKNRKGERVDSILRPSESLVAAQKRLKACNTYHLTGICSFEVLGIECRYNHDKMNEKQQEAQRFIARFKPCESGLSCEDPLCLSGHHCSKPNCRGICCKYPSEMHYVSRE